MNVRVLITALAAALVFAAAAAPPSAVAAPLTPSCAEGPVREGHTIYGTACADVIVAPPSVTRVVGGPGNDVIVGTTSAATSACEAPASCHLGVGSQVFEGGPGNDIVFGERGNDILRGGAGNDRLYGGIGDDLLEGGPGNDLLSGGFGADAIDGGPGSDFVRGDGTKDEIVDSGNEPGEVDMLSYATAVTPGFGNRESYPRFSEEHLGFPEGTAGRGVYLDLSAAPDENADNNSASVGGGVDNVVGADFERIIGSPFSDYIVGASSTQEIFGGGGADVLVSGGSGTKLDGGAGGDDCVGEATVSNCESTEPDGPVTPRDPTKVSVGEMAGAAGGFSELYLVGSEGNDEAAVVTSGSPPEETVTFTLGSGGEFDAAEATAAGCEVKAATEAVCDLAAPLDSVLLAGLAGDDRLTATGLPETTSLGILGGEGNDELVGGQESDDTLVDGPGNDVVHAGAGDDAILNNQGQDRLFGEGGNDLFVSTAVCEGDQISGGEGRDNASWTRLGEAVNARLDLGQAGRPGPGGAIECGGGTPDSLESIEDLEGSPYADVLYGDGGPNQLLGHAGEDTYYAGGGEDLILANSGDLDPTIDCGEDVDKAVIDRPQYGDVAAPDCENVYEADPNNFRNLTKLPAAVAPEPEPEPAPPPDTTPPQTRITHRPGKLVTTSRARRRVALRFTASEPGSSFRCRLDRGRYLPCSSPWVLRLAPGRHWVRIVAVDPSGNADPTAARFTFRLRLLRQAHRHRHHHR